MPGIADTRRPGQQDFRPRRVAPSPLPGPLAHARPSSLDRRARRRHRPVPTGHDILDTRARAARQLHSPPSSARSKDIEARERSAAGSGARIRFRRRDRSERRRGCVPYTRGRSDCRAGAPARSRPDSSRSSRQPPWPPRRRQYSDGPLLRRPPVESPRAQRRSDSRTRCLAPSVSRRIAHGRLCRRSASRGAYRMTRNPA